MTTLFNCKIYHSVITLINIKKNQPLTNSEKNDDTENKKLYKNTQQRSVKLIITSTSNEIQKQNDKRKNN